VSSAAVGACVSSLTLQLVEKIEEKDSRLQLRPQELGVQEVWHLAKALLVELQQLHANASLSSMRRP
jgi:hypothetical protein